jgi:transposase
LKKDRSWYIALHKTFDLKNTPWKDRTGQRAYMDYMKSVIDRNKMQPAIDLLADASSRTTSVQRYARHIRARMKTQSSFEKLMNNKTIRRRRFKVYQKEQRAVKQLSTDLLGGRPSSSVLIAWGNGSFGPTSRGHNSAPNKGLRKQLSKYLSIVLVNEYRTSKRISCCRTDNYTELRAHGYRNRTTVFKCNCCKTLMGRDVTAASNILNVLLHQSEMKDSSLPVYIR